MARSIFGVTTRMPTVSGRFTAVRKGIGVLLARGGDRLPHLRVKASMQTVEESRCFFLRATRLNTFPIGTVLEVIDDGKVRTNLYVIVGSWSWSH